MISLRDVHTATLKAELEKRGFFVAKCLDCKKWKTWKTENYEPSCPAHDTSYGCWYEKTADKGTLPVKNCPLERQKRERRKK